ncbi:hypothetical protein [Enterococcus mundtii]|uniref:Uncharacterized protein n=1 Tax=Enterococcus mundtii TaxID=53346 RepID=A0A2S7S011_ENTMU|nr:hypothetical protein [Enterococcus mundtii]MDA9461024.1 hypothetical protein [Enterococcus mundtii 3F]PQF25865.1 hypothetical protein CUS89_00700 [Enterococcus mundtii]
MKKRSLVHILVTVLFVITFGAFFSTNVQADESFFQPNTERVGVWWWDTSNLSLAHSESYLDYAKNNGITEIYLNQTDLRKINKFTVNDDPDVMKDVIVPTQNFIRAAKVYGIDVYFLLSNDGTWLYEHRRNNFNNIMQGFTIYQEISQDEELFAGLHFNVEPNQLSDGAGGRYWDKGIPVQQELMQRLANFAIYVNDTYGKNNEGEGSVIMWSTGYWWDRDEYTVDYNNKEELLYRVIIEESDTTVVMSFRTSAYEMARFSRNHLAYARSVDKPIILSGTVILAGRLPHQSAHAQFIAHGRERMHRELQNVPEAANLWSNRGNTASSLNELDVHVAIHEMMTWRHWARRER